MMVVDASVIVELLLGTRRGREVAAQIAPVRRELSAPHILDVEVAHALRRMVLAKALGPSRAETALRELHEVPITRYPHGPLLERAHQLRDNVTTYDAMYLVLAEALDAPLLTADRALAGIPACAVEVRVV